jgi:hypothetical protein
MTDSLITSAWLERGTDACISARINIDASSTQMGFIPTYVN